MPTEISEKLIQIKGIVLAPEQQLSTSFTSSCCSKAQTQKNSMKKLKIITIKHYLFLTLFEFKKCLNWIFLKHFKWKLSGNFQPEWLFFGKFLCDWTQEQEQKYTQINVNIVTEIP